ncbi:hypothetical protein AB6T38_07005 [Aliiglaciecola sp. SL4]|uniref:hypothetical protein n=1 Tax=Aliiglaciecola sp. SL4 TaxID=3239806 RepID=UPI00355BF01F
MTAKKLQKTHQGSKFRAVHCKGALDSFKGSLSKVETRKQKSFERALLQQLQRLLDGHRMSKENFPQEGKLPKSIGQKSEKKFNALKRKPLRGYCWLSEKYPNTYFISHYVYKDYDKLKEKDIKIVGNNWVRIEVNGDEC